MYFDSVFLLCLLEMGYRLCLLWGLNYRCLLFDGFMIGCIVCATLDFVFCFLFERLVIGVFVLWFSFCCVVFLMVCDLLLLIVVLLISLFACCSLS